MQELDARRVALGLQPAPGLQAPHVRPQDRGREQQGQDPQQPRAAVAEPLGRQARSVPGFRVHADLRQAVRRDQGGSGPQEGRQPPQRGGVPPLGWQGPPMPHRIQGAAADGGSAPPEQVEERQPRRVAVRLDPRAPQQRVGERFQEGCLIKVAKQ